MFFHIFFPGLAEKVFLELSLTFKILWCAAQKFSWLWLLVFYLQKRLQFFHHSWRDRLGTMQRSKYYMEISNTHLWQNLHCTKYNFTFIPHGLIRTYKWPAPNLSGFIVQLVRASLRYREVTGSNPIEVLNFSGFYIRNCINCVHNCKDHSLLDFTSTVQNKKYFISTFTMKHVFNSRNRGPE